ncbi:MAG: hypothetical protein GY899_03430 [Verrucomicrobiaceae bacterium]|nr:hypothetical protein [Verrucomicrobiaceae bacterium]
MIFIAGLSVSGERAKRKKPVPRPDEEIAATKLRAGFAVFREALENAEKLAEMKALLQKLNSSHYG